MGSAREPRDPGSAHERRGATLEWRPLRSRQLLQPNLQHPRLTRPSRSDEEELLAGLDQIVKQPGVANRVDGWHQHFATNVGWRWYRTDRGKAVGKAIGEQLPLAACWDEHILVARGLSLRHPPDPRAYVSALGDLVLCRWCAACKRAKEDVEFWPRRVIDVSADGPHQSEREDILSVQIGLSRSRDLYEHVHTRARARTHTGQRINKAGEGTQCRSSAYLSENSSSALGVAELQKHCVHQTQHRVHTSDGAVAVNVGLALLGDKLEAGRHEPEEEVVQLWLVGLEGRWQLIEPRCDQRLPAHQWGVSVDDAQA
eukprot:1730698-Prymnesium_polylepis.2